MIHSFDQNLREEQNCVVYWCYETECHRVAQACFELELTVVFLSNLPSARIYRREQPI